MLVGLTGLDLSFSVDRQPFIVTLHRPGFGKAGSFLKPKRSFRPAFAGFKPLSAVPG